MFTDIDSYRQFLEQNSARDDLEIIRLLGQRQHIYSLLKMLLDDTEFMQQIAAHSYFHRNGFDKIVLLSSQNPQYKLRMHIWWPRTDEPLIEDVHNHRWDFSSQILLGSYRNQEFLCTGHGQSFYEYKYLSPEGKDHYSMQHIGPATLECVFDAQLTAGDYYHLRHPVLHRIVGDRKHLTVTLILQGPVKKTYTNVFSAHQVQSANHIEVVRPSIADLSQKLEHVLARLEAEPCSDQG